MTIVELQRREWRMELLRIRMLLAGDTRPESRKLLAVIDRLNERIEDTEWSRAEPAWRALTAEMDRLAEHAGALSPPLRASGVPEQPQAAGTTPHGRA